MYRKPNICFDFSSLSFKFGSNFGTARPFSLCMGFIFLANLISGVIHGTEETERLVFEGMCLSAES